MLLHTQIVMPTSVYVLHLCHSHGVVPPILFSYFRGARYSEIVVVATRPPWPHSRPHELSGKLLHAVVSLWPWLESSWWNSVHHHTEKDVKGSSGGN